MKANLQMPAGPDVDDGAVAVALEEWRARAANTFLMVAAIACLPAVVLFFMGPAKNFRFPVHVVILLSYLVSAGGAVLRGINYRWRMHALLATCYALVIIGNIRLPHGPFIRALPVALPFVTTVVLGIRAGKVAAVVSIVVLLFAASLQSVPGLRELLGTMPLTTAGDSPGILVTGAALTALLVTPMLLLDRFHGFLTQSLRNLRQESAQRHAAMADLENEMNKRRRLEREIARVGDEERHRLGMDIHDGVCQQLTGALLRSEALVRRLERGDTLSPKDVTAISRLIEEAIDEAHSVSRGLSPLEPDPGALVMELRTLVRRANAAAEAECEFFTEGDVNVPDPATARHLYRIAQEALSNATRHGRASRVTLELRGGDDGIMLRVEDNGCGLPEDVSNRGMGLRTMAHRASLLEGELTVTPGTCGGTRVTCVVPRGEATGGDA